MLGSSMWWARMHGSVRGLVRGRSPLTLRRSISPHASSQRSVRIADYLDAETARIDAIEAVDDDVGP